MLQRSFFEASPNLELNWLIAFANILYPLGCRGRTVPAASRRLNDLSLAARISPLNRR